MMQGIRNAKLQSELANADSCIDELERALPATDPVRAAPELLAESCRQKRCIHPAVCFEREQAPDLCAEAGGFFPLAEGKWNACR